MDFKFTKNAQEVLKNSYSEAERLRSTCVCAEHILISMLRIRQCSATLHISSCCDTESLKKELEKHIVSESEAEEALASSESIPIAPSADRIIKIANIQSIKTNCRNVGTMHFLAAMLFYHGTFIYNLLTGNGIYQEDIYKLLRNNSGVKAEESSNGFGYVKNGESGMKTAKSFEVISESSNFLDQYGRDLSKAAKEGLLEPAIGRENEINRICQILGRKKKNNPILIGEAGVGKSSIVEGLAMRIMDENDKVSKLLKDKSIYSLDLALLVAGTRYRGEFEERITNIISTLKEKKNIIVFIDEIHTLVGAGNTKDSLDAANILKPALARGEIQCIGATTVEEYRQYIETDGALSRRFQNVVVEPNTEEEAVVILENIKSRYEQYHNVVYTPEALKACVHLTQRYINNRFLPDKAIDVMDEAGAKKHFESALRNAATEEPERIYVEDIAKVVSSITGVKIESINESEAKKLLNMQGALSKKVIGQDVAVEKVSKAIKRSRVGLQDPGRPISSFLFVGSTGVGKTLLAKELAKYLFGSEDSLVRLDMSEYMEKHSVSKLIGSPPGYVGYKDLGLLTSGVMTHPYSVVLLDEIEKAHEDVFNILLQILDEGQLTDSMGRKINFKNTIIIMTSNVGSRRLSDFGVGVGFSTSAVKGSHSLLENSVIEKDLKKTFSPEFLNRIDDVIFFNSLDSKTLSKIVSLELEKFSERLKTLSVSVEFSKNVKDLILKECSEEHYGARPVKRIIQRLIEDEISDFLLSNGSAKDRRLFVDAGEDEKERKIKIELK